MNDFKEKKEYEENNGPTVEQDTEFLYAGDNYFE